MKNLSVKKMILGSIVFLLSNTAVLAKEGVEGKSYFDVNELTSAYVSWGVDPQNPASINLLPAWKKYKKKKDIVVAVVDTGIDPTHNFLSNNIIVEEGKVDAKNFGVDYSEGGLGGTTPLDIHGHGSHISGIIKSVYPDVKILSVKYHNPKASSEASSQAAIKALKYAVDHNADIINYSGGGPGSLLQELVILKEAERKGILIIAAAGNKSSNIDERNKEFYPASYGLKNIITVTAHDQSLKILDSSNYGANGVDIFAPGYRINSSLQNNRTGYLTGTSQATAFVTGVAALLKSEYPQMTDLQIKEIIKASAKKEASMMGKCATSGRLDADAALTLAEKEFGEVPTKNRKIAGLDN